LRQESMIIVITGTIAALRCFKVCPLTMKCVHL
jgi:hypothetical protein